MKIKVLPDNLVNKISAGEVIERPSSVVRELVDNALDAGADDISVFVDDGGKGLVRVVDNGCGMSKSDALLAFERHATSKLSTMDDLRNIVTLGFRGEALPSIASVARVRMRTKPAEAELAAEILIEGGKIRDVREVSAQQGTDIEVSRIFFNTPARRKFLRGSNVEEQRVRSWLSRNFIARPHVRVRLSCDGREVLNFPPRETSEQRAASVIRGNTVRFEGNDQIHAVTGVIGHPSMAEADVSGFVIFVNGRMVSDRLVMKALKEGFGSTLKEREFPVGFMELTLPPTAVDVNVHPQKSEVRFFSPQAIYALVRDSVRSAVNRFNVPVSFTQRPFFAPSSTRAQPIGFAGGSTSLFSAALPLGAAAPQVSNDLAEPEPEPYGGFHSASVNSRFRYSDLRYVGEVLSCYLVCEHENRLIVIDMHAAHERCNYNRIRSAMDGRELPVQRMLVPLEVPLTSPAIENVKLQAGVLSSVGFSLRFEDGDRLFVDAMPSIFDASSATKVMREAGAHPQEDPGPQPIASVLDGIAARLACHASIRSGQQLTREEAYALLEELDRAELAGACPHGRPVVVSFSSSEVERWFGRDR